MVHTIRVFQGQRCANTGWEQNITYRKLAWDSKSTPVFLSSEIQGRKLGNVWGWLHADTVGKRI